MEKEVLRKRSGIRSNLGLEEVRMFAPQIAAARRREKGLQEGDSREHFISYRTD